LFAGDTKIGYFGDKGTKRHIYVRHFQTLQLAKAWFVERKISVCGIEIGGESVDVTTHPFKGDTAFVLGNEGSGMTDAAKAVCDHFVYIKHFGQGTASLNVTVAGSIVLHHFAQWAGYTQAPLNAQNGEKYNVLDLQYDFAERSEAAQLKAAQRAAKRARVERDTSHAPAPAAASAAGAQAVAAVGQLAEE
jgi:tRNA(Leu) C34 or U34 (ribose-2'-O)-methylase TrmL